ncbi:hypothetical protein GGI11_004425 [Coemansia sp. RSA 2049]|nr:hypothetical protein GGI11_004425 [Coemansia sp. RSA 2049]
MWTSDGGSKRPALSIGLFTPQVTVTSGSETNLLLGYVDVELDRPTEVKSLKVTLTGTYTAFWMDGNAGQGMRKEYYQNKLFHHDTITLTKNHLETRRTMFSSGSSRRGSRTVPDARAPLELCVRRADREWETVSVESSDGETEYTSEEGRRVSGVESGGMWSAPTSPPPPPAPSLSGARWTRRQYHDEAEIEADADVPTFAEAMAAPAASFSSSLSGFTLASGKHRFRFNMRLPARMPSTIASAAGGGIQYALAAKLKTRGGLLGLSSYADATCSVRVVNLPSRLAELQTLLPANDEAIFTRQIEDSWWILARLSSCTVSPGDSLQLSVTLAWPEKRAAGKADGAAGSVAQFVEVAGVQMDLVEHTVYRSLASGAVVKKLRAAVASQVSCGTSKSSRGGNSNGSNSSSSSSPFTCSVDSQLDFEVSIYTEGTAVPAAVPAAAETVAQTCFMCNKVIGGDGDAVNAHIDQCLARSAGESPSNEANEVNGRADGSMMVAYEWDGQIRIRATAMLEGGVVATGLGSATAAWYKDNDDDIDVDQEDETDYGPAQYSDRDLVLAGGAGKGGGGRSRGRSGGGSGGHSRQMSGPQFEEFVAPDDAPPQPQEGPSTPPPSAKPDTPPQTANHQHQSPSASQLVIDALKERIGQQDRLLQSVQKCLICLEPYDKPCASIHCWHVYCEKCWMLTLGAKKLCPQCLQITQPTDLRRVYL